MVVHAVYAAMIGFPIVLAQAEKLPGAAFDPVARAKAIAALVLLTIGGVSLVTLSWLFLRVGRRRMTRDDAAFRSLPGSPRVDDWATKRLSEGPEPNRNKLEP